MAQWHVMYTKYGKELLVESQLDDRGIETYFPYVPIDRGYNRGVRHEPYFPNYLFFKANLDSVEAYGVQWLPGVRKLLHVGEHPAVVPEPVVAAMKERLEPYTSKPLTRTDWLFRAGQKVVITEGPLEGFEAIFQKGLNAKDRVQVLLQMVGTWTRTEIDARIVKPA